MTLKEFFIGRAVVFFLFLIIGIGVFAYVTYFLDSPLKEIPNETYIGDEQNELSTFAWRFEEASSLNLDGIPETDIFLDATYSDGTVETKLTDTVSSSCNELPEAEEDSVSNSTVIQCYGAGLGFLFKITMGDGKYFVERKQFEEASPEYEPPVSEYEVIAEFPLSV